MEPPVSKRSLGQTVLTETWVSRLYIETAVGSFRVDSVLSDFVNSIHPNEIQTTGFIVVIIQKSLLLQYMLLLEKLVLIVR